MNSNINRLALDLDRAQRAVHAAESEWLTAYVADVEDTPETDAALRAARTKINDAKIAYAAALRAFDAARDA